MRTTEKQSMLEPAFMGEQPWNHTASDAEQAGKSVPELLAGNVWLLRTGRNGALRWLPAESICSAWAAAEEGCWTGGREKAPAYSNPANDALYAAKAMMNRSGSSASTAQMLRQAMPLPE